MRKQEHIVRYTAEQIDEMLRRGESQTDWARIDTMTEEDLEAAIDRDDEGEFAWNTTQAGIPEPQQELTLQVDADVIAWFKAQGAGYQTRMNGVLRSYVDAQK